jgi:hypothetical protein
MESIKFQELVLPIAGLLVGIGGIFLAWKYRKRRSLSYSFPIRRQIFSNEFASVGSVDLQLNGNPVRDLFLVELEIMNNGNETLFSKDFLKPIELHFNRLVDLIPISINRKKSDIPISWEVFKEHDYTVLRLVTDIIEPQDVISVDMLYESDSFADYVLEARLIDGKLKYKIQYEELIEENYKYRIYRKYKGKRRFLGFSLFTVMFFSVNALFKYLFPNFVIENCADWIQVVSPFLQIVLLIILMIISAIISQKFYDKKQEKEINEMDEFLAERDATLSKKKQTNKGL